MSTGSVFKSGTGGDPFPPGYNKGVPAYARICLTIRAFAVSMGDWQLYQNVAGGRYGNTAPTIGSF